jgi:ElaB/YqjD/DUF883 family membrane-anchored ribosome-binding protein
MIQGKIDISDSGIRIVDVEVPSRDVAEYVRALPQDEQVQMVVRAVEVGVFCLERAQAGQDLEFVRRQIDGLLNGVQRALDKIPDETQKQVAAKIGTGEGQVLAPVQSLVNEVSKAAGDKIQEIRKLLQEDIDPTKETSSLGKALRALREMLDPKRTDSIQGCLEAAVRQVTADSGALAKAVKDSVGETLKPLEDKVNDLAKEVRGREAAAEALEGTTQKGRTYEDEAVQVLQTWSQGLGVEVEHVGPDNRPGDVLLVMKDQSVNGVALRIVVEARDRQEAVGRMVISKTASESMAERSAHAAIYVSKSRSGLGNEVGDWAEGTVEQGRWVACTHEHLITGVRFLVVQARLQALRTATPSVDTASIEAQIQRIRTTLGRVKTINAKVTELRGSADEIRCQAEAVRDEIRSALSEIEEALRSPGRPSSSSLLEA